ncbi:MAG: hypothetical protein GC162_18995 [Planctomycetes bacterium]|nr:hypothetical protein [Planctomycetota bacterium]
MLKYTLTMLLALAIAPVTFASLTSTIDPVGGEQDGVEVDPETVLTAGTMKLKDFQAYINAINSTADAGVFDMNGTGGGAAVTEAGTTFSVLSTATVRTNRTDQPAVLATSETHHGFQESDATWTFTAPANRRVTHFGLVAIDWVNADTGMTLTAHFSDGSTAVRTFDDAPSNQDAWLGFVAPDFESITSVSVDVEDGGNWTAFDDMAFVMQPKSATTWVYNQNARIGAGGTAVSTDGWTGSDLTNWVTTNYPGGQYLRNANDGDDTITRTNDSEFSYAIPDIAQEVSFAFDARVIGNNGSAAFFQTGLVDGTSLKLGVGVDFSNSNKYFIITSDGVRHNSGVNVAIGDIVQQFQLVIDTLALAGHGSGTLYVDGVAVLSGIDMGLNTFNLSDLDGLYMRSSNRFTGPGTFVITAAIPAPAALPAGLAMMGLIMVRRRK